MKIDQLETTIQIPSGVTVTLRPDGTYVMQGAKGALTRRLFSPKVNAAVEEGAIVLVAKKPTMREKKILYTHASHLRNMLKGVTEGFEYRLKVCSGHFPMNVSIKGEKLEVKNFIGESVPRTLTITKDTTVTVDGEVITVTGTDLEVTSQMAARIEQLCRRTGFDRRIFQDGIYITHKDGTEL